MDSHAVIAPSRHTLVLLAILIAIATAGYAAAVQAPAGPAGKAAAPAVQFYLSVIAAELGLIFYVRSGVRRCGVSLANIVSNRPLTRSAIAADVVLAIVLFAALSGIEYLLARVFGSGESSRVRSMVAPNAALVPMWVLLSLVAGAAEEITFRGYLQRQFAAWWRSPALAIAAQAALFGITHGYQGPVLVAKITILGLVFGLAAQWRGSIVPGILAHAALDIQGGLAALH